MTNRAERRKKSEENEWIRVRWMKDWEKLSNEVSTKQKHSKGRNENKPAKQRAK